MLRLTQKLISQNQKIYNKAPILCNVVQFNYAPQKVFPRDEKHGYFANPDDISRRLVKLIALHDRVKNPHEITLQSTWESVGVDPLTFVEIMVEAEREFCIEIADEELERMRTIEDAVEHISRNFFTV
ncbi:mitochondrial type II fatty acid synthase component, putative [Ichthyophthirius multifiliis]|uniref:Acyl carrier protein n=1 Tax=Ichthyophthirius multifiliis TaxID=5932 RepID=G0R5M7_ICHMU|nr:mitochondrial type II fatty acid synthase component, putative [Ichthyophthirius multifiliis]EGR27235.1 mitochondrial type II fatty acid synthase component, putative [Ichthyophthirius multifiliis]|eukprot:XP_004024119.1 mitochondrial type II fatty acid synthase component, putative [Ichthyophthirius multifiliis]